MLARVSAARGEAPRVAHRARNGGDDGRISALDGVRAIAILLVMAHHFAQFLEPRAGIDVVVLGGARAGWVGVDLFFVLSGFLITGILYDTRQAQNYFRSFYARRLLRIFPLYYAALTVLFVVPELLGIDLLGHSASHWPWFWLYASNFHTALEGWHSRYLVHFWSLAIEEQFYVLWPLLVFLLRRRWLIALTLAVMVGAAVLRGILFHADMGITPNFTLTFTRADALAMGALIALLARGRHGRDALRRVSPWAFAVALPIAAFTLVSSGKVAWQEWGLLGQVGGYTIVALASGALVAWSVTTGAESPLSRFLGSRPLGIIGRYSYAMYVVHMPVDTIFRDLGLHPRYLGSDPGTITPALLLYSIIAGALTIFLAIVSWNLLERHFLALKRHFRPVFGPAST